MPKRLSCCSRYSPTMPTVHRSSLGKCWNAMGTIEVELHTVSTHQRFANRTTNEHDLRLRYVLLNCIPRVFSVNNADNWVPSGLGLGRWVLAKPSRIHSLWQIRSGCWSPLCSIVVSRAGLLSSWCSHPHTE